jgi:hypothetical protein
MAVKCNKCEAFMPSISSTEPTRNQEANKAWNTRASQWMPIETAPKDGSVILAVNGPDVQCLYWHGKDNLDFEGDDGPFDCWMEYDHECWILPKYWMPLPEPPKQETP